MIEWLVVSAQERSTHIWNAVSVPEFDGTAALAVFALVVSVGFVLYGKARG